MLVLVLSVSVARSSETKLGATTSTTSPTTWRPVRARIMHGPHRSLLPLRPRCDPTRGRGRPLHIHIHIEASPEIVVLEPRLAIRAIPIFSSPRGRGVCIVRCAEGRAHAEGRAEELVARADLAEEPRDVYVVLGIVGACGRRVDARKARDELEKVPDVVLRASGGGGVVSTCTFPASWTPMKRFFALRYRKNGGKPALGTCKTGLCTGFCGVCPAVVTGAGLG